MKQHFWNKRIPTFLGLVLIGIGLAVTTFLVRQGGFVSINASPTTQPQNVRISNVTDSAFTISYETVDPVFGVLSYGDNPALGKSALDDRDQNSGKITAHKIHNITLRNLNPDTKYYFSIISGKDTFLNNSAPFEVTTGAEISQSPTSQTPVSGTVILPDGQKPKEAIIYLTTDNSQVISTLVKDDGTFIIPLNSLRSSDFTTYSNLDPNQKIKLLVLGDGLTSNVDLSLAQTQPIPTITLSSDYDFSSSAPISPASQNTQSFPAFKSSPVAGADLSPKIITPTKDQKFTDQKPQFKGTAPAGQTVQIVIHTDEKIQTTVKTDANGNWTYRPTNDLSVGNHTITLIAKDAKGTVQTITQSFVVFASGSQIAGENGSPTPTFTPTPSTSSTLTPTKSPTPTLTPTKIPGATSTLTPTPTPTGAVTVTTAITTTSTNTPTVTIVGDFTTSLSPTPALPPTGNSTIITLGLIGLVITFIGGILFLMSRGSIL